MKAYQTLLKAEQFVCGLQKLQTDLEDMQDRCTRSVLYEYLQDLAREDAMLASVGAIPPQTEVSASKDAYFLGTDGITKLAEAE